MYDFVAYGVDDDSETLDYDVIRDLAVRERPRLIIAGATAYPRLIDFAKFRAVADSVGAYLMSDVAHIAGPIVAGLHPSPFPHSHFVTTTTHKTLRGPRAGVVMCQEEFAQAVDKSVFPGLQGGPLMHVIAAKAVAFKEASQPEFKEYQRRILENARTLAETLLEEGLAIVSGGTDNHLMTVDLRPIKMTGKKACDLLETVRITTNKNAIPNDPEKPFIASGIRVGSPAVTTRGMTVPEMKMIGKAIADKLKHPGDDGVHRQVLDTVTDLCQRFPLYRERLAGVK